VILDAPDTCQQAMFTIDAGTTTSRSWDIKVTQYACGDEDLGGKKPGPIKRAPTKPIGGSS
jgi:hypothetical protein